MHKRHSISIDSNVYDRLRNIGRFGETHTDVISRLLDQVKTSSANEYNTKVEGDSQT
jgi:predicted CopG family antitoxin